LSSARLQQSGALPPDFRATNALAEA